MVLWLQTKSKSGGLFMHPLSHVVASRWYNDNAMGSYHNFVSMVVVQLSLKCFHCLDTSSVFSPFPKCHLTDLFHRPKEIKYIWQVKRRWTIATCVFVFVRHYGPLEDKSLHICGIESICKPAGLHHPAHSITASDSRPADVWC